MPGNGLSHLSDPRVDLLGVGILAGGACDGFGGDFFARHGASWCVENGASKTVRRKQNGTLESRDENRDLGLVKRVSKFVE